jgi:enoyl-CoA hydratase/carnithine racemase
MTSLVHHAVEGGIATITLDSPANRNALSPQLVDELLAALDRAEQADVRTTVLRHTAPAFCSGMDLKARTADPGRSVPIGEVIDRLMHLPAPTIAAVAGPVRAGGVGLMAACDLVVVHSSVTFAFTEVRIGVAPAVISVPILARCPWSMLAAPFLTGEVFEAPSAKSMGLVTHVTDDVDATIDGLLAGLLKGGPDALAATKSLLRGGPHTIADMQVLSDRLFATDEAQEGMRSFLEQRPPSWQQR